MKRKHPVPPIQHEPPVQHDPANQPLAPAEAEDPGTKPPQIPPDTEPANG